MRQCMKDVAEFHHKFGVEQPANPRQMPDDLALFRLKFLVEELQEYADALGFILKLQVLEQHSGVPDLGRQLDSLVDLAYVTVGTGLQSGFDLGEAWARVQEANMRKKRALPDGSDSVRMSKFDVVKPAGWVAPDMSDLVHPSHTAPVQLLFAGLHADVFGVLPGEEVAR